MVLVEMLVRLWLGALERRTRGNGTMPDLLGQLQSAQRIDENGRDFRARIYVADFALHLQQTAHLLFAPVLGRAGPIRLPLRLDGLCAGGVLVRRRRCRPRLSFRWGFAR